MVRNPSSRVMLYSTRRFLPEVSRCHLYEFQDVVAKIEGADVVAPDGIDLELPPKVTRVTDRLRIIVKRMPRAKPFRIERNYDVLLAAVQGVTDLWGLEEADWGSRFKIKVCLMTDVWLHLLNHRSVVEALADFDVVLSYGANSVRTLQDLLPRTKVVHLPASVDTLRFAPLGRQPPRFIDLFSMGRRSEQTHRSLAEWALQTGSFYYRDVMQIAPVVDHVEYRNQLASLAQRAKFFIAYRGLVNKPKVTQHEVGVRYYEGAASGTLLLGEAPQNEVFPQLFDWPDPVIHLPYGSSDGPRVMAETLADAERVAEMRKNNVAHSLARHDTAHRWKDVLELLNMPLQQPHRERLAYLQEQSNRVHQNAIDFRD